MEFYNAFNFCLLTPTVKDFALKLENMLEKLEHHLLISEDGRFCKIYFHLPYPDVYPYVYDALKVYQMLKTFNKHKSYLCSFIRDCKVV